MDHPNTTVLAIVLSVLSVLLLLCIISHFYNVARKDRGIYLANPLESSNYKDMSHLVKMVNDEKCFGMKFIPDVELLSFATAISENYTRMKPGIYVSAQKDPRYRIEFINNSNQCKTPVRIKRELDHVQFFFPLIVGKKVKKQFVFFLVLWCFCFIQVKRMDPKSVGDFSLRYADFLTADFLVTTPVEINPVIQGLFHFWFETHGKLDRYIRLKEFIITEKNKTWTEK